MVSIRTLPASSELIKFPGFPSKYVLVSIMPPNIIKGTKARISKASFQPKTKAIARLPATVTTADAIVPRRGPVALK